MVLDLGSNIGCMSLHIAEKAKEVHGVEFYPDFNKIANLIKDELKITNCFFHTKKLLDFEAPCQFDVILSLAVHGASMEGFIDLTEKIYKGMLKEDGYLVFESRYFKGRISNQNFIDHLLSDGFVIEWTGKCQCENNYNDKQNQLRTFHVLRLESK
jgi:SAM-dependent methyltransferase